jgi:hypothetical protein
MHTYIHTYMHTYVRTYVQPISKVSSIFQNNRNIQAMKSEQTVTQVAMSEPGGIFMWAWSSKISQHADIQADSARRP